MTDQQITTKAAALELIDRELRKTREERAAFVANAIGPAAAVIVAGWIELEADVRDRELRTSIAADLRDLAGALEARVERELEEDDAR